MYKRQPHDSADWICSFNDDESKKILEAAHDGKEGLKVINDIVYKGDLLFVPPPKRYDIVRAAHESNMNAHPGILATISKLKENYWWPKMRDDVEHLISQCMACKTQKPDRSPP